MKSRAKSPAQSSMLKLEKQSGICMFSNLYFVEPAKAAKHKADLNKKLKESGKPTI